MIDNMEKIAELLQLSLKDLNNYKKIIDNDLCYYWNPKRGGIHVLVKSNGEKLAATSQISFEKLMQDFKNGKRN